MNHRPEVVSSRGIVAAGHHLAATAGIRMFGRGGNAADAAAAAGFALAVLEPHLNGLGGECPILVRAADGTTHAISGQGWAPAAATPDRFPSSGIPGDGVASAAVPATVDAWILLVEKFGKLPLREILKPAIELASDGFPVDSRLRSAIEDNRYLFKDWPATGATFGEAGAVLKQADLARTLEAIAAKGREGFYGGRVGKATAAFLKGAHPDRSGLPVQGLLTEADLAEYAGAWEKPVEIDWRGCLVSKCGAWTQGPVFLQMLRLLEGDDLPKMTEPEWAHVYLECAKLAFADREAFYGDPKFSEIPLERLLSREYAAERRKLVGDTASRVLRPGTGAPPLPWTSGSADRGYEPLTSHTGDTTHLDTADKDGLMVAATPSGGWFDSNPQIPGLGFAPGTRLQMFNFIEGHPNRLQPKKRPRTTLTPSLARLPDGRCLAFGTPGGDGQDQWTLQFFLNIASRGMSLQEAAEAPLLTSIAFPSSFAPHGATPAGATLEGRFEKKTLEDLIVRGHLATVAGRWDFGRVTGVAWEPGTGVMTAGVSPRRGNAAAIGI
ncbi:MAG: gamma-glutamyltransferase [Planctomycetota bacterium]